MPLLATARRLAARVTPLRSRHEILPFDMFGVQYDADAARRADKLGNIYHRGQDLAWRGQKVLAELLAKHGGVQLRPEARPALGYVLGVLMWGELAAWKIAAQLADSLVELPVKLAATSQAHDEARHFYVLYDYLKELGYTPPPSLEAVPVSAPQRPSRRLNLPAAKCTARSSRCSPPSVR